MNILNRFFKKESSCKGGSLTIKKRIIRWYLNTFVAQKDECYDYNQPSEKKMENKLFWIQIVDDNSDYFNEDYIAEEIVLEESDIIYEEVNKEIEEKDKEKENE